jgi:hypothetical protein
MRADPARDRSVVFRCPVPVLSSPLCSSPPHWSSGLRLLLPRTTSWSPARRRPERLDAAPSEVSLTFSADVLTIGAAVVIADASGRDWAAGAPSSPTAS